MNINRRQSLGSANVMYVHMQVSFAIISLEACCLGCICCVLMCVDNTSNNDMYLFKNTRFVFSANLNTMEIGECNLKQVGCWETERP